VRLNFDFEQVCVGSKKIGQWEPKLASYNSGSLVFFYYIIELGERVCQLHGQVAALSCDSFSGCSCCCCTTSQGHIDDLRIEKLEKLGRPPQGKHNFTTESAAMVPKGYRALSNVLGHDPVPDRLCWVMHVVGRR
jgi:hypothetical protein